MVQVEICQICEVAKDTIRQIGQIVMKQVKLCQCGEPAEISSFQRTDRFSRQPELQIQGCNRCEVCFGHFVSRINTCCSDNSIAHLRRAVTEWWINCSFGYICDFFGYICDINSDGNTITTPIAIRNGDCYRIRCLGFII